MNGISEIFTKLKGIESALEESFETDFKGKMQKFYPNEAKELFPEYNALITQLQNEISDLYNNFPERQLNNPPRGKDWIYHEEFVILKMDLKKLFEIKRANEIATNTPIDSRERAFLRLDNLFNNFHRVAQELRDRYSGRRTLLIKDEYDVQDLLNALLRVDFHDVRPEDYSPSNSGSNSRIDFILKNEKIGIEVKMTNKNLKDKKIGEELLIDIGRYKEHPDCSSLIIFIYDQLDFIRNKQGLKRDLEQNSSEEFTIKVYINPS